MNFTITKDTFVIDGRPQPLLCGEMHYFRMPRAAWAPSLDLMIEAGCNAVAFYIPWLVHEYEEDCFDFSGERHELNDLRSFMALTAQKGLIALARIGPYVYAETSDLGLPRWFTEHYPDAHPLEYVDGAYRPYGMERYASHCHPDFLARTGVWYARVMAELRPHLAPEGNIYMVQLCNEIPGDDHRDENPRTLGLGDPNGLWPLFLKQRYGTADALGASYHTSVADIDNCPPHELRRADAVRYERDKLAYYYEHYYPRYFEELRRMAGPLPEEVTFFHNAYNPKAYSLHSVNKQKNPWLNIGVDCYYSMTGALTLEAATYFNDFGARYGAALVGNPPWVIEQACGYWNDTPVVYGPELYIWNVWSFVAGYRGANLYLFTGGENRDGLGYFGTWHGWQAPVTKDGQPDRTYRHIKQAFTDIREHFDLFCQPDVHDMVFAVPGQAGLIWTPTSNVMKNAFHALRAAGFNPRVVDLEHCTDETLSGALPVWVVCGTHMSREAQNKLCGLVRGGGRLIVQGALPLFDENGRTCTLLADELSLTPEDFSWARQDQQKITFGGREYYLGKTVQPVSGDPQSAMAHVTGGDTPAVWRRGRALVLPFELEMLFFDMERLLTELLAILDIAPVVRGARYLRVFPKQNGASVVLNLHPEEMHESVTVCGRRYDLTLPPYSFIIVE